MKTPQPVPGIGHYIIDKNYVKTQDDDACRFLNIGNSWIK